MAVLTDRQLEEIQGQWARLNDQLEEYSQLVESAGKDIDSHLNLIYNIKERLDELSQQLEDLSD